MFGWLLILIWVYILILALNAYQAHKVNQQSRPEYLYATGGVSVIPLFLSYSATLFSTFTVMGIPDFFRTHGVGTWLFIGVTDVAMGFVILWFGLRYRKVLAFQRCETTSELLRRRYASSVPTYIYRVGVFVFLIPYVAIQIQGVSALMTALAPSALSAWMWSGVMMFLILGYSSTGGLRAVIYSDVTQGILLFAAVWLIGIACINLVGGLENLFEIARTRDLSLMSAPGPTGMMSAQYLISSFLVICLMPVTQPQLTARVGLARDIFSLRILAAGTTVFAFFVLLPTIAIGLYGVARYPGASPGEFLAATLVNDQAPLVGALAVLGLIAAAMSTADSQLFSLRAEASQEDHSDETSKRGRFRWMIIPYVVVCFLLSLISSTQLVSLARVSFAGTALMAPMILAAVAGVTSVKSTIPWVTAAAMTTFTLSTLSVIPANIGSIRVDLALLLIVSGFAVVEVAIARAKPTP